MNERINEVSGKEQGMRNLNVGDAQTKRSEGKELLGRDSGESE